MNPVLRLLLRVNQKMMMLSWSLLALLLAGHFLLSWLLLLHAGETSFTAPDTFYYFYIVTASTVGYGDFSPKTPVGQMVTSLLVIPGGVILFAGVVGKITTDLVNAWRITMKGKTDYQDRLSGHLIIMGWHRETTTRMIDLVFGDRRRTAREVVLVASEDMENPYPARVHYVSVENLASEDAFQRAAVKTADRIIITGHNDDNTLTTALSLTAFGTRAHIVCYFEQQQKADLLKAHAPEVECHVSITTEMLVRSAQDPGSSRVQSQLLSTLSGPTQFSLRVPDSFHGCNFSALINGFKEQHDALVLGLAESINGDDLVLNPHGEHRVEPGHFIYFMSRQRLHDTDINWQALA